MSKFSPNTVVAPLSENGNVYLVQKDGQTLVHKDKGFKIHGANPHKFKQIASSWSAVL